MPRESPIAAHLVATLSAFSLVAVCIACGPAPGSEPEARSQAATTTGPANPGSGSSARDFETLDVCALVPVAEVAEILGREPSTEPAAATMGPYAASCTYSFDRGDGFSDYTMIWVYPPELWAPELKANIQEVSGLGDLANLEKPTSPESFARMNVLLEGDLYIDARTSTPELARALAGLALERLAS